MTRLSTAHLGIEARRNIDDGKYMISRRQEHAACTRAMRIATEGSLKLGNTKNSRVKLLLTLWGASGNLVACQLCRLRSRVAATQIQGTCR